MEFKTKYVPGGNFSDIEFLDPKWQDWKKWQNRWTWNGSYKAENSIFLEYYFETPDQGRDRRSDKPCKIVHQEYFIMPLVSFAGNVGGTLGMFIGFSFLGTSEWLMTIIKNWYETTSYKFKE